MVLAMSINNLSSNIFTYFCFLQILKLTNSISSLNDFIYDDDITSRIWKYHLIVNHLNVICYMGIMWYLLEF